MGREEVKVTRAHDESKRFSLANTTSHFIVTTVHESFSGVFHMWLGPTPFL